MDTLKVRAGFISNSSSSSFMVGIAAPKGLDLTNVESKITLDLTLHFENIIETKEQLRDVIFKTCGIDYGVDRIETPKNENALFYNACWDALDAGNVVLLQEMENDDITLYILKHSNRVQCIEEETLCKNWLKHSTK